MKDREVCLSVSEFAHALCLGSFDRWACAVVWFSETDSGVSECTHL